MARNPKKKPPATAKNDPQAFEEQMRQRAYELYEARGRKDGNALDDWLRAEAEITKEGIAKKKSRTAAA